MWVSHGAKFGRLYVLQLVSPGLFQDMVVFMSFQDVFVLNNIRTLYDFCFCRGLRAVELTRQKIDKHSFF